MYVSGIYISSVIFIICFLAVISYNSTYKTLMDSELPVIEIVMFRANQGCLDDPALFKEVREMVVATTRYVQFELGSLRDTG